MRPVFPVLFLTFTLLAFNAGHILPGAAEVGSRKQKVWARAGSSAVLPCYLSHRKMGKSWKQLPDKTSVLWKRLGGSTHQEPHVVLEVEDSGLRKTALPMRPRVSLQDSALRNGNFSLSISPVRSEDAGLYEAWVMRNTKVQSCHVELEVITVTLSPPSPVVANEPLLLQCNSSHRASLVETCWFHNGRLVPTSRTFCSSHGALSILRPTMSDAGSWRCQLRYSDNEIISAMYNLQILGFEGPANPVVYAAAGSAADLPCTLSYLPSAFGINVVTAHWSRLAGGHLQDRGISYNSSSRSFPLHLPAVGLGDAGQYRCAVSVSSRMISRDVTLAVVTVTPSIQGPVSEGSHLLLICSLTHPQGHERFQWKQLDSAPTNSKLAKATSHNLRGHRFQMGPTLEIPHVSQKDTGTWECSVYGPEGRLGAVEYGLQITGAQVSSPPTIFSGQVTFGLTLTFFLLLTVCVMALALQKRARSPAFPALDGMIAIAMPRKKEVEENQKENIQQTEC
ncbi:lymphocyte activation gene 3 protein isoform X1 [Pezoporus occidentalis]|uniref:lymphocyte activation gene 3 protein isoform X1 n=2 Tax=Pezoporus occidentalis TaxID=407982 RepID=UPI002F90A88E